MPGPGADTKQLIQALRAKDASAFRSCYLEHKPGIFRYLCFWTGRVDVAEDLLQDTFQAFWQACAGLRENSNVRNFLLQVARNKALDYQKRIKPQTGLEGARESAVLAPDPVEQAEQYGELYAEFAALPREQREVLHLRVYNDLTFEEIADLLNIPTPTAKSRYRYGLDKLRKYMTGE